jgi:hypothetical protein
VSGSLDARFYDPEVGRFTSQDSYLGEINDPPSLHRYFYANANPTRYVDPTGHAAKDWIWAAANETERAAKATFNTALGPLRTPFNVAKRSIEEKSIVAGVRGELRDTFNKFGAMDAAERVYREGGGLPKAAEEGAREHLANMAASVVPVRETITLLAPDTDGWQKAEAAANFIAKGGSLLLGMRGGAPRAAIAQEGHAATLLAPTDAGWQRFLPEAEARLAAAKAKYGDSPLFAMERPQAPASSSATTTVIPDDAFVVRGGVATPEQIARGIGPHRDVPGLTGFSAQSRAGATVEELAATGGVGNGPFPNGQVSVSTAGQLRCIGCDVIPSPGAGANHVTVTPGPATPAQISEQLKPRRNPARPE